MSNIETSQLFQAEPFMEGELFRTTFFDSLEELEDYVHSWGMGEGQPKRVLSACCIEAPADELPRWESEGPCETSASVTSMLEVACQMNALSDEIPDYAEVVMDMQDGARIMTASIHTNPRIIKAGGSPYKVVIENVAINRRAELQ